MNRRTKIIIILIVLILVALGLWLILGSSSDQSTERPVAERADPAIESIPQLPKVIKPLSTVRPSSVQGGAREPAPVESFARSFVERYGSYSQESNFENIEDLYSFMTGRMQEWAQGFVENQRAGGEGQGGSYSGINTRVITITPISQDADSTQLKIATQRTEQSDDLVVPQIYYQDIEISLVNVAGEWKVSRAEWQ